MRCPVKNYREHDDEVDEERNGDPDDIEGKSTITSPFSEHDEDGEQKRRQGDRADARNEHLSYQSRPLAFRREAGRMLQETERRGK